MSERHQGADVREGPLNAARGAGVLRVVTTSLFLEPLGGVEICTLEDAVGLTGLGHHLDVIYGHDGSMRPVYEAAGVGLAGPVEFALNRRQPLWSLSHARRAARMIRALRPDVMVLERIEHLIWGSLVSELVRCPLVCHLHGPPVFGRIRQLGVTVSHFVAVSEFVRQSYLDRGIPAERMSVVYNAIPENRYPVGDEADRAAARAKLGLPPEVFIVLCYGQMTAAKGLPTLIDVWPEVLRAHPDALLVLVDSLSNGGDPEVAGKLAGLDPRCYRVFPATMEVVPFLHASDVVAFPTMLPEAFGRVVIEGMATGRPVVASRVGAVPELLAGPMAEFLVEPGAAGELAGKLNAVLDWRVRQPGLGAECAKWVRDRFPFATHLQRMEDVLRRNARPRPRRAR